MNHHDPHPDNEAIALLARALMPIFAAALERSANEVGGVAQPADDPGTGVELPRAA
jgi:hypothetical protein